MDFRISICLEDFFKDERSFCYIFLDKKKYEHVADLKAHLDRIFNIPTEFCLMIDKYLLPNAENIRILKPDDVIKVKPTELVNDDGVNYKVKTCKELEAAKEIEELVDKCDKVSKKKKKKKSKRSTDDDDPIADSFNAKIEEAEINDSSLAKCAEKDLTMESLPYDYQPKSEVTNETGDMSISTKCLSGDETNNNSDHEDMPLDMDGMENTRMIIKHIEELKKSSLVNGDKLKQINETSSGRIIKRRRIRKRKKSNNIIQNMVPDVKSSLPNSSMLLMQGAKMSNHIRFDDCDKTIMQNGLNNRPADKPRIVHAIESLSSNFVPDNKTAFDRNQENNCSLTDNCHNGNIDNKTTDETLSVENVLPKLNKYKNIDSLPLQGVILFKMLTMAENYVPKVSEYILGKIIESQEDATILKLNIIDGHKECQEPSGKFDLDEKSSINNDIVEIEWSQVYEAKLICP